MCAENGLDIDVLKDPDLILTELENNLIARNIISRRYTNFQNQDGVAHMIDL